MPSQFQFSEYFKTLSTTDILEILENPHNYEPEAIEVAKDELSSRQLSEVEIEEAKEPLIEKQEKLEQRQQKIKAIEDKVKSAGDFLSDTLNPVVTETPTATTYIRIITVVYGLFCLYSYITNFRGLWYTILDMFHYPIAMPFVLLMILEPVAIYLFWKRKHVGWNLLVISIVFTGVTVLKMLLSIIMMPETYGIYRNLSPQRSSLPYLLQLLFAIGNIYVLCKPLIREVYEVNAGKMRLIIISTVVFTFMYLYILQNGFR